MAKTADPPEPKSDAPTGEREKAQTIQYRKEIIALALQSVYGIQGRQEKERSFSPSDLGPNDLDMLAWTRKQIKDLMEDVRGHPAPPEPAPQLTITTKPRKRREA